MEIAGYNFINELQSLPFVETIYLFGSRARGDNQRRSDIDLAVKISSPDQTHDWFKVVDVIDRADTLLEIDCVNLDRLSQEMINKIKKEGIHLYGKA